MEVINELHEIYLKAEEQLQYSNKHKVWESSEYNFDNDPPCIVALLENGTFELGSINMAQMRLAAYLKMNSIPATESILILDEWLFNINPLYIYEIKPGGDEPDYTTLKAQNRYVVRTVYASTSYGFSCGGIKQIPGVADHCTKECRTKVAERLTVSLFDATKSEYRHKRITVLAESIGRQDAVYIIPKVIKGECFASRQKEDKCIRCPLYNTDSVEFEITAATNILKLLETVSYTTNKVGALLGIPNNCNYWRYTFTEQNAELIHIVPPVVDEYSDSERHTKLHAYYIGHGLQTNRGYKFSGYCHVVTKTSTAVLVFDSAEETEDSLTLFEQTDEMKKQSKVFSSGSTDVYGKLNDIVDSLVRNYIRVWNRNSMIMAMDLTYHSVRRFYFQERLIRGWMNLLVIGDSGQAKSETAVILMKHFNMGYKTSSESATRAGLLWGIDMRSGSTPSLIWGAIPRYSGRIVVIDELKELIKKDALSQLTEARSSGIVNVDAIVAGKALAETRLIMLTNPKKGRTLGSYIQGVEAIGELIPDLEDIRRFDLVVGVASKEVSDEILHRDIHEMPTVEEKYTSEICKNHLLYVWNVTPDRVKISPDVEHYILEQSLALCKIYSPAIPIVEPADHRLKVARITVAVAARLNAFDKEGNLIPTIEHVNATVELMNTLYKSDALRYDEFSDVHAVYTVDSKGLANLKAQFKNGEWSNYWRPFVDHISEEGRIQAKIMAAACGTDIALAARTLTWMVAKKLCRLAQGGYYYKNENGVTFVRELLKEAKEGVGIKEEEEGELF